MSLSFLGYPFTQYLGTPYALPMQIKDLSGKCVPLNFNWSAYGVGPANPNLVVNVNLNANSNAPILDKIRSIYIDNLASAVPIFVQFLDTNFTVVAQPNSAGWYPVFTNNYLFTVSGLGFTTDNIPSTLIYVTNILVYAYTDNSLTSVQPQYIGTPFIQGAQGGAAIATTGLGPPALGDQSQNFSPLITGQGLFEQILFPVGYSTYLTAIQLGLFGAVGTTAVSQLTWSIATAGNILFSGKLWIPNTAGGGVNIPNIRSLSGMNLRLDASKLYVWTSNSATVLAQGQFDLSLVFSTNY